MIDIIIDVIEADIYDKPVVSPIKYRKGSNIANNKNSLKCFFLGSLNFFETNTMGINTNVDISSLNVTTAIGS